MALGELRRCLLIVGINLRHNFLPHACMALVTLGVTPVLFGINDLDALSAAVPLEMFISLIGIVLMTPIFLPEQNVEIHDVVASKYTNTINIWMLRLVYSILTLIVLVVLFVCSMRILGSAVSVPIVMGTLATAFFLGALGVLASSISASSTVGYMVPILYYAMNFGLGPQLGNFYLFTMSLGSYTEKVWLVCTGILLLSFAFAREYIVEKKR